MSTQERAHETPPLAKKKILKVILCLSHLKSAVQISLQPEASCLCCRLFVLYMLQINIVPFGTIKISFETQRKAFSAVLLLFY